MGISSSAAVAIAVHAIQEGSRDGRRRDRFVGVDRLALARAGLTPPEMLADRREASVRPMFGLCKDPPGKDPPGEDLPG
jgi:hypothetical protein